MLPPSEQGKLEYVTSYEIGASVSKIDQRYFEPDVIDEEWRDFLEDLEQCIEIKETRNMPRKRRFWQDDKVRDVTETQITIGLLGDVSEDGGVSTIILEVS